MSNARTLLTANIALLVLAVAGSILVLGRTAGVRAQTDAALAVDCEGNTVQIDRACQFGTTQEFTVSVHVTAIPGEYGGTQVKLTWDPAAVNYLPTDRPAQEAAWPDCSLPLRSDNRPDDTSVLFGCINFTASEGEPIRLTTYTGPVVVFHMQCVGEGTSELSLVPFEGDPQFGSALLNEIGQYLTTDLSPANVTCSGADVVRPEPEVTVGVDSVAETPVPGNGGTTPADGETARPSDGSPTPTPGDDGETPADGDDDGDGFPVWGWILIVVVVLGGLGAAGAGWMRYRSSRTAT